VPVVEQILHTPEAPVGDIEAQQRIRLAAGRELHRFLAAALEDRKVDLGDDLLSSLLQAR